MNTREIKLTSLSELKDQYLGEIGSKERDEYEYQLSMNVLGKMIKVARKETFNSRGTGKIGWSAKSSNIKTRNKCQ